MPPTAEPDPQVTGRTRVFALLGDPVVHSFSPLMQNAAFRAARLDGVYVALRCGAPDAPAVARALARAGGGGNVTVPHKTAVVAALDLRSDAVLLTGACNTFWAEQGQLCGDNTDVAGFRAAAQQLVGSCAGLRVLILGAGGAARAAVVALAAERAAEVVVCNRSVARAAHLASDLGAVAPVRTRAPESLARERFDLVVNATPAGLHDADPLPLELNTVDSVGAALDLVVRAGETRWTRHARELGIAAAGGATMLVAQGAAAFERWWPQPAPVDVMRLTLERALSADPSPHGVARPARP